MQKHVLPTKLSFKGQLVRIGGPTSVDGNLHRLEVGQKLQNIEIETGPDRFAVLFAADDFLNRRIGPNLPKRIVLVRLGITKADL